MRRILSMILALACLVTALPVLGVSAKTGDVLYDWDFSTKPAQSRPVGITTANIPTYGDVRFDYKEGTDTVALLLDDTDTTTKGVTASIDIPALSGKFTIHSKFSFNNGCVGTLSIADAFSITQNAKNLTITTSEGTFTPFDDLKYDAGKLRELEMWACMDTSKKTLDLYLKSPEIDIFWLETMKGGNRINGVYALSSTIKADKITSISFATKSKAAKNYVDFIRVYDDFVIPEERQQDAAEKAAKVDKAEDVLLMSAKEAYYTRAETKKMMSRGFENFLSLDSLKDPNVEYRELTGSAFIPKEEDVNAYLDSVRGVHPRVLFTQEELDEYVAKFYDPYYDEVTKPLLASWESLLNQALFVYDPSLSNSKYNVLGTTPQSLSIAYHVTGDERYRDRAIEWIRLALTVPHYGDGVGLGASGTIAGMGVTFDLLYDELPEDLKKEMVATMLTHGDILYRHFLGRVNYLHNIFWAIVETFAFAPLAIYDEPGAEQALDWLWGTMGSVAKGLEAWPADGTSLEGTGYFGTGMSGLTPYLYVARRWGMDALKCEGYVNAVKNWRIHMSFPRNAWTGHDFVAQFGDAQGYDFGAILPMLCWVGSEVEGAETVLWLADELIKTGLEEPGNISFSYLLPIFYDKDTMKKALSPGENGYPTMGVLDDSGYVVSRTDWSGDESAVYFSCGFKGGVHAMPYLRTLSNPDLGAGHNEPAENHFLIHKAMDQLICSDLYTEKRTEFHNTLLVNGQGQLGGDSTWYDLPIKNDLEYEPSYIRKAVSYDDYDYFVGAAANSYDSKLGLEKFDRHMLHIKSSDAVLVIDDIKTKEKSDLELRFFTGLNGIIPMLDGYWVEGQNTEMYVENLTPDQTTMTAGHQGHIIRIHNIDEHAVNCFTTKAHDDEIVNVTLISWSPKGTFPAQVDDMKREGDVYTFVIDNKEYTVNINDLTTSMREVEVKEEQPIDNELMWLNIGGKFVDLKEGVYEYDFNLDDFYLEARGRGGNRITVSAYDKALNRENITVTAPKSYPGTVEITVKSEVGEDKHYKIHVKKTNLTDLVERVEMTVTKDTNSHSPQSKPSKLIDGSWSWGGVGFRTNSSANYAKFDLGEVTELVGFDIAWTRMLDDGFEYYFTVSDDGVNFTEAYRTTADTSDVICKYFWFPEPIKARYVNFVIVPTSKFITYTPIEVGFYKAK